MTDKTIFAHLAMNKRDNEPTLQQLRAYAESMTEDIRHTKNAFKVLTEPFSRGSENVQAVIKVLSDRVEQMSEIVSIFFVALDIYCERQERREEPQVQNGEEPN